LANIGYKLVGVGSSAGNYEGHDFNNVLLYATYDHDKITGAGVKVIKAKATVYTANPVKVGEHFDVNYDEYKHVKAIVKL